MGSSKQLEIFKPPPPTEDELIDARIAQARADRFAREATKPKPGDSREIHRSRRKRDVRAATISMKRLTKRELEMGRMLYPEADDIPQRPRSRDECAGVPRPCPFVSCRHHLYLDVSARTGAIKLNFPDLEVDELPADKSCALDVADVGGVTLEEVGAIMNLTRERIRQVELKARAKMEAVGETFALREFYGEGGPVGKRRLPVLVESEPDEQPDDDGSFHGEEHAHAGCDFDAEEFAGVALDAE